MWRDIGSYASALWKHWVTLLCGSASAIVGILNAILKKPLPNWYFWCAAILCFAIASFQTWKDEHDEVVRLGTSPFAAERLEYVHGLLEKLDAAETAVLREVLVRGKMQHREATHFLENLRVNGSMMCLRDIEIKTGFVAHDKGYWYRVNPEFENALERLLGNKVA